MEETLPNSFYEAGIITPILKSDKDSTENYRQYSSWIYVLAWLGCHNKMPWNVWLKKINIYLPKFWRLGSPTSRYQLIWLLVKVLFLVGIPLPSQYVLMWPFFSMCIWREERMRKRKTEKGGKGREGQREKYRYISSFSFKATNVIMKPSPLWLNLTLITSQRPHLQITLGLAFQHMNLGGEVAYSIHNK